MSILENIQSLCEIKGISIPKLEKELGFGKGSIYKWDVNSPSIDKVQKVAQYFQVSIDRLLEGFDRAEFTRLVNIIKGNRTFEQFAKDTKLSMAELFDIVLGMKYDRPTRLLIEKISDAIPANSHITEDDLLEAAGYISERQGESIKERFLKEMSNLFEEAGFEVRFENEDYYEKVYIDHPDYGTLKSMFLHEFIECGESLLEELKKRYKKDDIQTLAAHHDGEDWTPEELEEIERFKEFVRMRRKMKDQG